MANGGSSRAMGDERRGYRRSRTTVVIDHLLSRGPLSAALVTAATGGDDAETWLSVFPVLHDTAPSILEGHLTWLVSRVDGDDHLSPSPVEVEDQTRILIRALEQRGEDDVVIRALEQSWNPGLVPDDDGDIAGYVSGLRSATADQPDASPFVALARSADHLA